MWNSILFLYTFRISSTSEGKKFPICLQQKLSSSAAWPKYLINASWECGAGRRKQVAHLYLGLKKFSKELSTFGFVSGTQKVLKRVLNILCLYLGLKNFQRVVNSLCLYLRHKKFSKGFSIFWVCICVSGTPKLLQRVLNILCLYLLGLKKFTIFYVCIWDSKSSPKGSRIIDGVVIGI